MAPARTLRHFVLPVLMLAVAGMTPGRVSAQSAGQGAPPPPTAADQLRAAQKKLDDARGKALALQKKAEELEQDIQRIREGLVAAARVIQHHEHRIDELETRLAELNQRRQEIQDQFKERRAQLGQVLAALQRMARNPPEALIAQPISPADTVRSAILLRAVLPRLEGDARVLGERLAELAEARREAEASRTELDDELGKLEGQRNVLKSLLGRKSRLRRRTVQETTEAGRETAQLARQAASLQDLVVRLNELQAEQKRRQDAAQAAARAGASAQSGGRPAVAAHLPPPSLAAPKGFTGKPFDDAKGQLPFPVIGRVVARYGQIITSGRAHKGLTMETAGGAQVIAPYEGKVVFSGPFRGYGQLLIIEHTGGYHTLLAGMARIDATVGHWLLVGEPVGIMGQARKISVDGRDSVQRPALYVEFRRKGQPIDPLAWLAARKGKVSG
jgi:septal ring factor EnvC (AmiA/AmiB activator)